MRNDYSTLDPKTCEAFDREVDATWDAFAITRSISSMRQKNSWKI